MENGLFSSPEFAAWSKQHVAYLHITTRLEERPHELLFRELGFTGFPTLAFLDQDALLTAKHQGDRDTETLGKTANLAAAYLSLRSKAASGDSAAAQQLFLADLKLNRYSFARASLMFTSLRNDLSKPVKKQVRQSLVDLQFAALRSELSAKYRAGMDRNEYAKQYSALYASFFEAGRIPSGRNGMSLLTNIMGAAKKAENADRFAVAFSKYKVICETETYYTRYLEHYETQLAELRAKK